MRKEQIMKWEATRTMGRNAFILKFWVLGWGVTTALFNTVIRWWWFEETLFPLLGKSLVLFPIGGYFLGAFLWRYTERKWHKWKQDNPV